MSETKNQAVAKQKKFIVLVAMVFLFIVVYCLLVATDQQPIALQQTFIAPNIDYWFGTDALGRDLWQRTISGLLLSLKIGIGSALLSGLIAIVLTIGSGLNRTCEWSVSLIVDMFSAIPHLLLLMVMTLAFGGGMFGVIWAVALSHWPKLTRLLIEEQHGLIRCQFVVLSSQLGRAKWSVLYHHVLPFLLPHSLIGILLMIPHTLIHVASLTFLGFGLEPSQPSIGILLSEASRYMLSGHWWMAVFPGLVLLVVLLLLSMLGRAFVRIYQIRGY